MWGWLSLPHVKFKLGTTNLLNWCPGPRDGSSYSFLFIWGINRTRALTGPSGPLFWARLSAVALYSQSPHNTWGPSLLMGLCSEKATPGNHLTISDTQMFTPLFYPCTAEAFSHTGERRERFWFLQTAKSLCCSYDSIQLCGGFKNKGLVD